MITKDKHVATARQLRIAKLEYEIAQTEADEKKKIYENLRTQMANDMVMDEMPKFEIAAADGVPGLSFRLETKERWSPVVDSKDQLMDLLKTEAPDLFTVTAPALSKYIGALTAENNGELPERFKSLVKMYEDTHVVVRTKK